MSLRPTSSSRQKPESGPRRPATPTTPHRPSSFRRKPESGPRRAPARNERGDTLPLLIIWPALLVSIMLLALHAFILSNAQAEAAVAASEGLRAAWRAAAESDLGALDLSASEFDVANIPLDDSDLLSPEVVSMSTAAKAAVAASAAGDAQSWRWWSNGVAVVSSDWCGDKDARPRRGEGGWVRVTVSGEVLGPLAALWPERFDRVHAVAEGPARFVATPVDSISDRRSDELAACP